MTESTYSRPRRRWTDSPNLVELETRAPAQIRYGHQLPDINTPRQMDGTLVPLQGRKSTPRRGEYEGDEKLRQMELRLGVAEKSHRALLEELLRLQSDMQATARRNEEVIRDEKGARQNLESALKISNELISTLGNRLKDAEEKLQEERSILSSLVNHTKGVEQAVKSSQNELMTKKDIQGSKLSEMRLTMDDLNHIVTQQERQTFQMAEELRMMKMKVESQIAEFGSFTNEFKAKSKKLEDDSRLQLDSLRKYNNAQSQSDQSTQNLRAQVESRLAELRDVLMEIRSRQDSENGERRNLEQNMTQRIHELQQQIGDTNRKREETLHSMEISLREKEHSSQADRLNLTSKVADSVEDINKKLLSKEIKIREEMQERYLQLEKIIQQEQQQRRENERTVREDNERKIQQIKIVQDGQSAEIKDLVKSEKSKNKETMNKLDDSITILEKHVMETRKSLEKLIAAEISQRKIYDKDMNEKLAKVNEKLQIATSTLQQSVGGITQTIGGQNEKIKREMRTLLGEQKEATTRGLADLDARINFNKNRMHDLEEKLEAKLASGEISLSDDNMQEQELSEASQTLSENLREKVDSISLWQETTGSTIKELSLSVRRLPDEIYSVQEKQTLMKSDMNTRMTAESDARIREVENLKQELQELKMKREPQAATIHDVENVQASLRKLADSIQTVKTVLGMKIQSEQKLRVDGLEDLQTQINQLKVNVGMPNYGSKPNYLKQDPFEIGSGSNWDDPITIPEISSRGPPPKEREIDPRTESTGGRTTNDTGYATATETQMSAIPEDRESTRSPGQQSVRSMRGNKTNQSRNGTPVRTPTGKMSPTKSAASPTPSKANSPIPNSRNQTPGATPQPNSMSRRNSQQRDPTGDTLADV